METLSGHWNAPHLQDSVQAHLDDSNWFTSPKKFHLEGSLFLQWDNKTDHPGNEEAFMILGSEV
jgi:hypothetical protein